MDLAKYLVHAKWSKYVSNNNDDDYQRKCIPERIKDTKKIYSRLLQYWRENELHWNKKKNKKTGVVSNMGWASRLALENAGRVGGQSNQAMHVCYLAWLKLPPSHRDWEIGLYLFWWFHLKNQLPGLWESHSWL